MTRSDEAAMWYSAVYRAVREIPHGNVTTYGHIARLCGFRTSASNRLAGAARPEK